jgi:transmembrane sensor
MSTGDSDKSLDPLTEAALEWLVRLHSGDATARDWQAYDTWRGADPARQNAATAAERLWEALGPALRVRRSRPLRTLTAAVLLICGALGLALTAGWFGPPAALLADHRTSLGERRSVILADGSRVDLDTATKLDVDFTAERRRLVLYGGAIHVTVSPDASRPFEVEAAGGVTRALGTAFDVRNDGRQVRVAVTEHQVRVTYPRGDTGAAASLSAGQQIAYGPDIGLAAAKLADTRRLTAWRRGYLVFDNRPLGAVIDEMQRYHAGWIVVADAQLRNLPVTGVFDLNAPEALLGAVAVALPVRLRSLPWLTLIEPDPTRKPN